MDTVGTDFFHQFHVIVNDKYGTIGAAQILHGTRHRLHLVQRGIFHPQLNPVTAALQGHPGTVEVAVTLCEMRDKLKFHLFSHIILRKRP